MFEMDILVPFTAIVVFICLIAVCVGLYEDYKRLKQ